MKPTPDEQGKQDKQEKAGSELTDKELDGVAGGALNSYLSNPGGIAGAVDTFTPNPGEIAGAVDTFMPRQGPRPKPPK